MTTPDENHHCCSGCDATGHCTHGLQAAWYSGYDRGVRNTLEVAKASEHYHFGNAEPIAGDECEDCAG